MNLRYAVLSCVLFLGVSSVVKSVGLQPGDQVLLEKMQEMVVERGRFFFLDDTPESLRYALIKIVASRLAVLAQMSSAELDLKIKTGGEKAILKMICFDKEFLERFKASADMVIRMGLMNAFAKNNREIILGMLARQQASVYLGMQILELLAEAGRGGLLTQEEVNAAMACVPEWQEKVYAFERAYKTESFTLIVLTANMALAGLLLNSQVSLPASFTPVSEVEKLDIQKKIEEEMRALMIAVVVCVLRVMPINASV
ncbi:TPA: hypothetical protein DDZ86_01955 [Candidatus Dependentiae bacterium]|nr:MAG: hypothetical protein UW09_C0001G0247 [candidate division TM6 bacterium GW2011_GWF2_43_87]HBL98388.1 hypothetical protein [Candidatus Dependentiae bacterium]